MPHKNDYGAYEGTTHFNIKYKAGAIFNRVLARDLEVCSPSDIEWVWIVEEKRQATADEIRKLCAGKWKSLSSL